MPFKGSRQLTILFTCPAASAEQGDRVFADHAKWMEETHYREGEKALLFYSISKGFEQENPLDPSSARTGRVTYALTEIYAKRAGLEDHWRQAMTTWDGFDSFASFARKCIITTLHGAEIVQTLWDDVATTDESDN